LAEDERERTGTTIDRATAADFVRSFAKWRDKAQSNPVEIASHGRVTHVMVSSSEYERLRAGTSCPPKVPEIALFGLAEWMKDAIIATDREGRIVYSNNVAKALTSVDLPGDASIGLIAALPILRGTVIELNYDRTRASHEPTYAEVPSPFRQDGWLLCRTIPLNGRVILILSDITEEFQRDRMADTKQAIVKAMIQHGSVGYIRVSARGVIKEIEDPFCDWLNLPGDRIRGRTLMDFVSREYRLAFREALELVLDGSECDPFDLALMPNGPGELRLKCAMSQLRGQFGVEGAVLLCTLEAGSSGD